MLACLALAAALVTVSAARAENWPQWRGPFLNGSTNETGLPDGWTQTENVAWATELPGRAAATPVVWGDRVFVSSEDKKAGGLVAMCLDTKTGRVLWQRIAGKARKVRRGNTTASPSPLTDGRAVYFMYGSGDLVAFDLEGNRLWSRGLEKDFGVFMVQYRYSSSPLLYGGRLYLPVMQHEDPGAYRLDGPAVKRRAPLDSFLLAVDPATGKDLWRSVRPSDATGESRESYSTLIPYEGAGRSEIILAAAEHATGHDAGTGAELWRWEFSPHSRKPCKWSAACVVGGEGLVYVVRPKRGGMYALRAGASGSAGDDLLAWRYDRYTPYVSSPLLYRGRLYVVQDENKLLSCLDARTGEVKWRERLGFKAVVRSSPTGADGKVHVISQNGEVAVVAAQDEFRVLSRAEMGGAPCQSTIVVADGRIYVRTAEKLYCIGSGRLGGRAGEPSTAGIPARNERSEPEADSPARPAGGRGLPAGARGRPRRSHLRRAAARPVRPARPRRAPPAPKS